MAVSPQTIDATRVTGEELSLEFTLLSDHHNEAGRKLGLVFALPSYLRPVYEQFGIDLPAVNGDDSFELPVPATYVIDKSGTVRWAHIDLDYRTRAEPGDILLALDGLD